MSDLPEDVQKYTDEYLAKKASFKNTGSFERPEVMFKKGARFFKDEQTGKTMFGYRSSAHADYVAKATDSHRDEFPKEWIAYTNACKAAKK